MDNSFKYIRDNKGIDSEAGYPYYARVSLSYLLYFHFNLNSLLRKAFQCVLSMQ